jgi:hypothetical protein
VTVNGTSSVANWVGINGTGNGGRLIQAGTYNEISSPTVGSLFWENYCSSAPKDGCNFVQPVGTTASPGDDISVSVSWNPKTNVSYYAVTVGSNGVSTNELNVQYADWPGSHSGNVADFITERDPANYVPEFTHIQFSLSRTYTAWNGDNYVLLGDQLYQSYVNTSDGLWYTPPCVNSSAIIMYPENLSGGSFQNIWCNYS